MISRLLLEAFQQFFREHSESWLERFDYKEAGPQLLMQTLLQRIVNGGGFVEREYRLGLDRTDLLVIWPYPGGVQRAVIKRRCCISPWRKSSGKALHRHRLTLTAAVPKIFRRKEVCKTPEGDEQTIDIWGI